MTRLFINISSSLFILLFSFTFSTLISDGVWAKETLLQHVKEMALKKNTSAIEALTQIKIITQYGLNDPTLSSSKRRYKNPRSSVISKQIKGTLERELQYNFYPKIEESLGLCTQDFNGKCIRTRPYLNATYGSKNICLPSTSCNYYKCMEDKYQCSKYGVKYFTKLATPTCSKYVENINKGHFGDKAIKWIYSVMVCLQKGITLDCDLNNNCSKKPLKVKETCDHIVDYTLKFHSGCYLKTREGICKLPLADKLMIWKTVGPYLTLQEKEQAIKVILKCVIPF